MKRIYDLIIIGAGPAGITAAVYAARKKIDTLVVTKDIGGQAALSGDIQGRWFKPVILKGFYCTTGNNNWSRNIFTIDFRGLFW